VTGPGGTGGAGWGSRVVLALGSNLGDRLELLQEAVDSLGDTPGCRLVAVSPVYETEAVGGPEQGPFLNAVVLLDTMLPPADVLQRAKAVEAALGRERTIRWGPRRMDVDVVVYADVTSDDPELTLPHPRAHERAFVLAPWQDVDPAAVVPGRGEVARLLGAVGTLGIRRRDDLELRLPE
jgi:2-amino-4-hydroxy-6-hydroxymethyldihydropteridine diphosphokinase